MQENSFGEIKKRSEENTKKISKKIVKRKINPSNN
jgi:hypothetical protein